MMLTLKYTLLYLKIVAPPTKARGVVMTTSMLLGWLIILWSKRNGYYILHGGPIQMLVITNMCDLARSCHHKISTSQFQHHKPNIIFPRYLRSDKDEMLQGILSNCFKANSDIYCRIKCS